MAQLNYSSTDIPASSTDFSDIGRSASSNTGMSSKQFMASHTYTTICNIFLSAFVLFIHTTRKPTIIQSAEMSTKKIVTGFKESVNKKTRHLSCFHRFQESFR